MYLEHFGLRERPFLSVPDLRFVYLGEHHERALAYLLQDVQGQRGLVHLTGESGVGKTTLARLLLNRLPERAHVALILDPVLTSEELLTVVCDELGVACGAPPSLAILGDALARKRAAHLSERPTVLIVDEAQSLGLDVLEPLDRLSRLELDGRPLLEIILIGEPGLTELLARAAGDRPPQSIATGYYLPPFTENETCAYVRHRLAIAGGGRDIFDIDALRDVHHLSSGLPRVINTICARALLSAVAQKRRSIDRSTVRAAARSAMAPADSPTIEARDEPQRIEPMALPREPAPASPSRARRPLWPWLVGGGLALNAVAIGAVFVGSRPLDLVAPLPDTRAKAEPPARIDAPDAPPTAAVDDPSRAPQTADLAPPTAEPPLPAPPSAPAPTRPNPPSVRSAPDRSPPADETPRQRRRRARDEARPVTPSPPRPAPGPALTPQDLKIEMLVWAAEPGQRMVYVNGQKYVEGETLENGAVLQQIEENGIVVIQEGKRLRLRPEASTDR